MLKITTKSGTVYYLDGTKLKREGVKPLKNVYSHLDMDEPDWEDVSFTNPPEVGEHFYYYHPTLYGCASTVVVSIEEVE